jgi:hypothetical protein
MPLESKGAGGAHGAHAHSPTARHDAVASRRAPHAEKLSKADKLHQDDAHRHHPAHNAAKLRAPDTKLLDKERMKSHTDVDGDKDMAQNGFGGFGVREAKVYKENDPAFVFPHTEGSEAESGPRNGMIKETESKTSLASFSSNNSSPRARSPRYSMLMLMLVLTPPVSILLLREGLAFRQLIILSRVLCGFWKSAAACAAMH